MTKVVFEETQTWALGGYGTIGSEVTRQLAKEEVGPRMGLASAPEFIIRQAGIMAPDSETKIAESIDEIGELPDNLFLALPSDDKSAPVSYELITRFLDGGQRVITAEKGALANHFTDLKQRSKNFRLLGIDATVGGGTHMLRQAERHTMDPDNISEIHLALNGTLNFIFDSISSNNVGGTSVGQAVYIARREGYVDPTPAGKPTPKAHEVIRDEAAYDVSKKTAILFNYLGLSDEPLNWRDLIYELKPGEISRAIQDAANRRYIVSIYPKEFQGEPKDAPEDDIIGQHEYLHRGWRIVSGFRKLGSNPFFFSLGNQRGPKSRLVIAVGPDESDGDYDSGGHGAGPGPTVNSMIDNYAELRKRQQELDDYVAEVEQTADLAA